MVRATWQDEIILRSRQSLVDNKTEKYFFTTVYEVLRNMLYVKFTKSHNFSKLWESEAVTDSWPPGGGRSKFGATNRDADMSLIFSSLSTFFVCVASFATFMHFKGKLEAVLKSDVSIQ
jgi:hypothetical protein